MAEDFIGKGWSFPPHFNKGLGEVEMVSGKEEIEQSLKILFSTNLHERLFHPTFGCSLRDFLFAANSRATVLRIQNMISATIRDFEPRIILNKTEVDTENMMDGYFSIHIDYTIRATNMRHNMIHPHYFE